MNSSEAASVLTLAAVFDNRTFDESTARVWADALQGLHLDDCLDAVRVHYRKSRQWLMPADVRELARSIIRERKELQQSQIERLAIEQANLDPDTVVARAELVRQAAAQALAIPDEDESPHPKQDRVWARKALAVACSWCKAPEKQGCVNSATGRQSAVVHDVRLEDADLIPRRATQQLPQMDSAS